jgi:hypothetical protein
MKLPAAAYSDETTASTAKARHPRSSPLRRSSHFSYEGWKLRDISEGAYSFRNNFRPRGGKLVFYRLLGSMTGTRALRLLD